METVFLGGIHGTGKSYLGGRISRALGYVHYSAGELLSTSEKSTRRGIAGAEDNQFLILRRLTDLTHPRERIVLDGHFALVSTDDEVKAIPTYHWIPLSPLALLILDTPVEVCQRRLRVRDGAKWNLRLLEMARRAELRNAEDVSKALGIPLAVLQPPNEYHQALAHLRTRLR